MRELCGQEPQENEGQAVGRKPLSWQRGLWLNIQMRRCPLSGDRAVRTPRSEAEGIKWRTEEERAKRIRTTNQPGF